MRRGVTKGEEKDENFMEEQPDALYGRLYLGHGLCSPERGHGLPWAIELQRGQIPSGQRGAFAGNLV